MKDKTQKTKTKKTEQNTKNKRTERESCQIGGSGRAGGRGCVPRECGVGVVHVRGAKRWIFLQVNDGQATSICTPKTRSLLSGGGRAT